MTELNIVQLIENNPLTKLSSTYQSKLLTKIKESFTDNEQQLFVSSFYCYLNCNQKTDFVIDLDKVWKWMGFSKKDKAKRLLEKSFILDKDYKILLPPKGEQNSGSGGHNKEIIIMTVNAFKSFCLKADTKKADEIHEYYMKLENMLHELIDEETTELKNQLQNVFISNEKEKEKLKEKTLLSQFPKNTQCIYYGKIDNKSTINESLIKFGYSNNLNRRVEEHKKNYTNFTLVNAFKVSNQIQIENAIKKHEILKKKIRSILIENVNYIELIAIDDFTLEQIDEMIKDIITEYEYNIENYKLLIEKHDKLEYDFLKLEKESKEKDKEIEKLKEKLSNYATDITNYKKNTLGDENVSKCGFLLYAFRYEDNRYKCSVIRKSGLDLLTDHLESFASSRLQRLHFQDKPSRDPLKKINSNGEMQYCIKVSHPFIEKIMTFIMKKNFCFLGNNKFEGSFEDIKNVMDITVKLGVFRKLQTRENPKDFSHPASPLPGQALQGSAENVLINNSQNLENLSNLLDGTPVQNTEIALEDPEVPKVRKAKRAVDQIDPVTSKVIASFPSIEAAGRVLGLTTGTAIGVALRNKTLCKTFLWRYSGISKEEQYADQPIIKVCCSTGEKKYFNNIADAAKDAKISAPALRQRVLTKVHIDDFHWIFDKTATHYNQELSDDSLKECTDV